MHFRKDEDKLHHLTRLLLGVFTLSCTKNHLIKTPSAGDILFDFYLPDLGIGIRFYQRLRPPIRFADRNGLMKQIFYINKVKDLYQLFRFLQKETGMVEALLPADLEAKIQQERRRNPTLEKKRQKLHFKTRAKKTQRHWKTLTLQDKQEKRMGLKRHLARGAIGEGEYKEKLEALGVM